MSGTTSSNLFSDVSLSTTDVLLMARSQSSKILFCVCLRFYFLLILQIKVWVLGAVWNSMSFLHRTMIRGGSLTAHVSWKESSTNTSITPVQQSCTV